MKSLSSCTFPIFFEEWNLDVKDITSAWNNKGDIVIGNDVWIGDDVIQQLLKLQWWNWSESKIRQNIAAIQSGKIENMQ